MDLFFKLAMTCVLLISLSCKKDRAHPGIEEANITLTDAVLNMDVGNEFIAYTGIYPFKSYFAATGIQKSDSSVLVISTRSITDHDYDPADLVIKDVSYKNFLKGTIGEEFGVFGENTAKINVVSPNLFRYRDELKFIYLKQNSFDSSDIFIKTSKDEKTWSDEIKVNTKELYHTITNSSVCVTKSGRIIIPTSVTRNIQELYAAQSILCYYSDDGGESWFPSTNLESDTPLMEPSVAELKAGHLIMVIRSQLGKLIFSESFDEGATWSKMKLSKINSPASTSNLTKISEREIALVWNNSPKGSHVFDRTPLNIATTNNGVRWSRAVVLANQPTFMYSSPTLFRVDDSWVVLYNRSKNASDYDMVYKVLKFKR